MFDAYDRDDPGRHEPHHRFFVADRTVVLRYRRTYRALSFYGFKPHEARAEIIRTLLHDDQARFI